MRFLWEPICQEKSGGSSRAKVPGGWIVNSLIVVDNLPSLSSVFIYDPEWKWSLEE